MTGRHARLRKFPSPTGIAATAAVAVAVVVGGTAGAVYLTSTDSPDPRTTPNGAASAEATTPAPELPVPFPSSTASPSVSPSPTTASDSPSPAASRTTAPSRSKPRTTSSPSRQATPTASKSTSPRVVDSGTCGASFYGEGQLTANGETFNPEAMTAAHKTLPFGTRVRVTNPATGASVTVRINDRGPFIEGRCLDLSRAAFRAIASLDLGILSVRYEVLG